MKSDVVRSKFRNGIQAESLIIAVIAVAIVLSTVRLANIDADLPATGVGFTLSLDEGSYSKQALNYYEYGSWSSSGKYPFDTGDSFKSIVFGNLLQIVSMRLFGDTYLGFRLPYVLMGLSTIVITLLLVRSFSRDAIDGTRTRLAVVGAVCLLVVFDFPLQLCTRTVESSVVRMLGNLIMLLIWLGLDKRPRFQSFLLGFWGVCCVFFIYFSNVTPLAVLLAYGIWLLIRKEWKAAGRLALWSVVGILAAIACAELYYIVAWGQEAFSTFYGGVFAFSRRLSPSDEPRILFYFTNLLKFSVSNMFFFNPLLLGLSLIAVPLNYASCIKRHQKREFLISMFILMFMLQCLLTDDWAQRKSIVVFPFILFEVIIFIGRLEDYIARLRDATSATRIVLFVGILSVYCCLIIGMFVFRSAEGFIKDFTQKQLLICTFSIGAQAAVFVVFLVAVWFQRGYQPRHGVFKTKDSLATLILSVGFVVSIGVSAAYDWKYIYGKPTFTEREAMISIGKKLGTEYVADPLAYSYLLYNDIRPINNDDEVIAELFKNDDVNYMIDYAGAPYAAYNYVENEEDLSLVAEFYREPTAWGVRKNIGIFEKAERTE